MLLFKTTSVNKALHKDIVKLCSGSVLRLGIVGGGGG